MKVKELIELLQKHDPEKEVMIQQGMEYDYAVIYSTGNVSVVIDRPGKKDEEVIDAVGINYD
jgi:hypothetical protein